MNKGKDKLSLEQALEQYYSTPVPGKEFLANLEQSLQAAEPVIAQPRPKRQSHTIIRPVYAFLAAGLIMIVSLLLVGPANAFTALKSLIRYIPGFGLVEDKTTLRVLAEPVSVTRDGVTVIVKQAVLSPDAVSLTYLVQNLPAAAKPDWVVSESGKICIPPTQIRLHDGTLLDQLDGGRGSYDAENNYQYVVKFGPVPYKDDQATWLIPCLPYTLAGKAPSDWEIPLRFAPAPKDFAQLPVIEVAPTASAASNSNKDENPLSLDRVVETEQGYIFIGRFRQSLSVPVQPSFSPEILDGNGLLLGYTLPSDITISSDATEAIEWAYQVNTKEIAWPITLRFNSASVFCTNPQAKISFDAGASTKSGQVWELNQNFSLAPCKFQIQFVKWTGSGYLIRITNLVNTFGVQFSPWNEGPMAGVGAGSVAQYPDHLDITIPTSQEPPKGRVTLYVSAYGAIPGPWQVIWQPGSKP